MLFFFFPDTVFDTRIWKSTWETKFCINPVLRYWQSSTSSKGKILFEAKVVECFTGNTVVFIYVFCWLFFFFVISAGKIHSWLYLRYLFIINTCVYIPILTNSILNRMIECVLLFDQKDDLLFETCIFQPAL